MKWRKGSTESFPEKTFLVIKNDLNSSGGKKLRRVKSKSAADTGTWPPKLKKHNSYSIDDRPKTANLDKPSILDPKLVNKLDMSLLSKELLCDSMTRIQLMDRFSGGLTSSNCQSLKAASDKLNLTESKISNVKQKYRHSIEQLANASEQFGSKDMKKQKSPSPVHFSLDNSIKRRNSDKKFDDNNNKSPGISKTLTPLTSVRGKSSRSNLPVELEVFTNPIKEPPEPCKTCGRPDQPERFHSHPKPLSSPSKASSSKSKDSTKQTIQKPVALNFRSEKSKKSKAQEDSTKGLKGGNAAGDPETTQVSSRPTSSKRGPRTVTCYICGREFGTASFPIHEPHCMRRWERENNALPPSQKRPAPQRPNVSATDEKWNAAAWELSQMQLVPCGKCGRTFLPDRLPVHEKSCKATPKSNTSTINKPPDKSDKSREVNNRSGPPTVSCSHCGRNFGTRSIKIHEPQCLKRWKAENERRKGETDEMSTTSPKRERSLKPESVFLEASGRGSPILDWSTTNEAKWKSHLGQLIPCKHCKRTFNPDRVGIHERNCKG